MNIKQLSLNVRYLLWTNGIRRDQWSIWLQTHTPLDPRSAHALLLCDPRDASPLTPHQLGRIAQALDFRDPPHYLHCTNLVASRVNILRENLSFLSASIPRGGAKRLCGRLEIHPTTWSRFLRGNYTRTPKFSRAIVLYFGLPPDADLTVHPIFLAPELPDIASKRRRLQQCLEALTPDTLQELYPALMKILARP